MKLAQAANMPRLIMCLLQMKKVIHAPNGQNVTTA